MITPLFLPNLQANGNINPSRWLTTVSGNANFLLTVQATASTAMLLGISESWTRYAPNSPGDDGFHAKAGEQVAYLGALMKGPLKIGGTVSDGGVPLTSDASGQGIAQAPANATTCWYGGIALEAAVSGDTVDVWVLPPTPTV